MIREIKYRAFDKERSQICDVLNIDFESEICRLSYSTDHNKFTFCKSFDEIVLMQYTGLLDKNNVQIYDGDILKCSLDNEDEKFVGEIIYDVEMSSYMVKFHGDGVFYEDNFLSLSDYNPSGLEVIGNAYENPELLEKTK